MEVLQVVSPSLSAIAAFLHRCAERCPTSDVAQEGAEIWGMSQRRARFEYRCQHITGEGWKSKQLGRKPLGRHTICRCKLPMNRSSFPQIVLMPPVGEQITSCVPLDKDPIGKRPICCRPKAFIVRQSHFPHHSKEQAVMTAGSCQACERTSSEKVVVGGLGGTASVAYWRPPASPWITPSRHRVPCMLLSALYTTDNRKYRQT